MLWPGLRWKLESYTPTQCQERKLSFLKLVGCVTPLAIRGEKFFGLFGIFSKIPAHSVDFCGIYPIRLDFISLKA